MKNLTVYAEKRFTCDPFLEVCLRFLFCVHLLNNHLPQTPHLARSGEDTSTDAHSNICKASHAGNARSCHLFFPGNLKCWEWVRDEWGWMVRVRETEGQVIRGMHAVHRTWRVGILFAGSLYGWWWKRSSRALFSVARALAKRQVASRIFLP